MKRHTWILGALALAACGGGAPKAVSEPEPPRETTRTPVDDGEEEEPDDVEVEGLLGRLDRADIQPVIERSWDQVQACYSEQAGGLRYVGGQVELQFRVARDGTVKHVHVRQGSLGAWPVEKCVLAIARAMTFPKPKGGEAEFTFPIDFPSRGRTLAMEEERVSGEVAPKLAELASCGEAAADAPLPSAVTVTIYVAKGGVVTMAGFAADGKAPIPDAWADCAHAQLITWKLTDPRGKVWKAAATFSP